jgi:nitrogen PTS system EIIA component
VVTRATKAALSRGRVTRRRYRGSAMQLVVKDVSALLDVPEKTVYRWISRREIPVHRVHDEYRFSRDELLDWATERKLDVSRLLSALPDEAPGMPTLVQALEVGGVHHGIAGVDKSAVLEQMVGRLTFIEEAEREILLELLLARESLSSTGVGDGIALPHARRPIVVDTEKASVSIGFLAHPVDFASMDGIPVRCLFLLVSPTPRVHLHLLSRLSQALKQPSFREAIDRSASQAEIMKITGAIRPAVLQAR